MNWLKKLIGASILTSLLMIVPEKAQAELCGSCGLYNTGGYNLYSLGQNMNSLASCAAPITVTAIPLSTIPVSNIMTVPSYLSNPTGFLNSFAQYPSYPAFGNGGSCGTFTQSCGSCYDTLGFGGYGTLPMTPPIDNQLMQLIAYQNLILNQMNNPFYSSLPYQPTYPVIPSPLIPPPLNGFDNSIPFPTTPSLPYGGCDNLTVMCPQPTINSFDNIFPGGNPATPPSIPEYIPELGVGALPPVQNLIPRGLKTHR